MYIDYLTYSMDELLNMPAQRITEQMVIETAQHYVTAEHAYFRDLPMNINAQELRREKLRSLKKAYKAAYLEHITSRLRDLRDYITGLTVLRNAFDRTVVKDETPAIRLTWDMWVMSYDHLLKKLTYEHDSQLHTLYRVDKLSIYHLWD